MPDQAVVITVARIQQPAPGKKQGAVFDTSDKRWGVWPDHLDDYQVGMTYRLTEIKSSKFDGKMYYTIVKSELMPNAPKQAIAPQASAPLLNKDEMIFVEGPFNRWAGGKDEFPSTDECVEVVNRLRETFRRTFGNKQQRDDMQDEIPY